MVVAVPPCRGRPECGQVLQHRAERLSPPPRQRQFLDLAETLAARGGVAVEVGPEPVGDVVGDPGVQVARAVAAASQEQLGGGLGTLLLGEQLLVLGLLGDVGGEVFQHSRSEHLQLARPELGGFGDQQCLGLGQHVLAEVGGQRLQGLCDDAGLGQVHLPGRERGRGPAPPPIEHGSKRHLPPHRAMSLPGLVRQPGGGGPVPALHSDVVGIGQHSQLLGLCACDQP